MAGQSGRSIYGKEELIQKREAAKKVLATNKGLSMDQKRQLLQLIQSIDAKLGDNSVGDTLQPKSTYQEKNTIFNIIAGFLWIIVALRHLWPEEFFSLRTLLFVSYCMTGVALISKCRNAFLVISYIPHMLVVLYNLYNIFTFKSSFGSIFGYAQAAPLGFVRSYLLMSLVHLGTFPLFIAFVADTGRKKARRISFFIMICITLYAVIGVVLGFSASLESSTIRPLVDVTILQIDSLGMWLFTGLWCAYPSKVITSPPVGNIQSDRTSSITSGDAYIDLLKHILFLIFTLGIWYYIWVYRITGFLNRLEREQQRDPTCEMLLCIFVPFYGVYWTYKSAQRIDVMAQENGVYSDLSTLCLITAIFIGIVPPILIQDKLNAILLKRRNSF